VLLRQGLIPRAHKISRELRGLRDTMRIRLRLVQQRSDTLRRLKSIAAKFNGSVPDDYRFQLAVLEHTRDSLSEQILVLEKSLHPVLIPNDDIQRLLYIPASANSLPLPSILKSTVSNDSIPTNSLSPTAVSFLLPITPTEPSIIVPAKMVISILKIAFSDAAVHAIQYYPEYKRFFQKRAKRSGEAIARTCVAKELAKIVYYILKNKSQYKGLKGQPISRQKSAQWPRVQSPAA